MIIPIGHDRAIYRMPVLTFVLMGACLAIQLLRTFMHLAGMTGGIGELPPSDPIMWLGYVPADGLSVGLFTSAFVHAGYLHLISNMVFLWLTGASLEYRWGWKVWGAIYALGAVVSAFTFGVLHPDSPVPLVGASGAVATAMGAFLVTSHSARIRFWYFYLIFFRPFSGTFTTPAFVALPLWFLGELINAYFRESGFGGVAYSAHVSGFALGFGIALALKLSGYDDKIREAVGSDVFDEGGDFLREGKTTSMAPLHGRYGPVTGRPPATSESASVPPRALNPLLPSRPPASATTGGASQPPADLAPLLSLPAPAHGGGTTSPPPPLEPKMRSRPPPAHSPSTKAIPPPAMPKAMVQDEPARIEPQSNPRARPKQPKPAPAEPPPALGEDDWERLDNALEGRDAATVRVEGSAFVLQTAPDHPEEIMGVLRRMIRTFDGFMPLDVRALAIAAHCAADAKDPEVTLAATRTLITHHPRSRYTPGAMLEAARVQEHSGWPDKAQRTLQNLVKSYPESAHADTARKLLSS